MRPIPAALTAIILVLPLLAGCYDRKDQAPEAAPPPEPAAVLAGVDLGKPVRALGTEPFWSVEITPDGLTYTRVDQPAQHAPNRGATVQGTVATYATSTDLNEALNVVLIATECSDGMSDRAYPLTAKVEIGDDTLTGCAASVAALATRDEAG